MTFLNSAPSFHYAFSSLSTQELVFSFAHKAARLCSSMANSDSLNKPHFLASGRRSSIQPNPSKSYTRFLFKSVIVLFVLVLIPLFPSQAPEFISQTILTKIWELLHLLFIGIAVCYGLFSRRSVERNSETYSKIDNSHAYLSGFLHVSSIFEDGLENPCGSDGKRMIRTWNSQYFQGESMIVAAQENYVLDHKPLGLPIRSLESRVIDTDTLDSINGSGSSSSSRDTFKSSEKTKYGKTRGMVPINLEEKFKETAVLSSPIPWRSRSGRMEMGEEIGTVKPPSHSRPPSVGEFEFGSLKSHSSRPSVSSQNSSLSSSPKKSESLKLPSHSRAPSVGGFEIESLKSQSSRSSVSSQTSSASSAPRKSESTVSREVPTSKVEDLERKKSFDGSPVLHSPLAPIIGEASFITSKARRFSTGSSSDMNVQRSYRDSLKDLSKKDDPLGRRKSGVDYLNSEMKRAFPAKCLSRGKSVRTIRASETVAETRKTGEIHGNRMDGKVGNRGDKFETNSMENTKRAGLENQPFNSRIQNKSTLSEYRNGEKKEFADSNLVESEKDKESEFVSFQLSSDEEEIESDIITDAEVGPSEVDRKAGEFIAKFREQIRLQRIASFKG